MFTVSARIERAENSYREVDMKRPNPNMRVHPSVRKIPLLSDSSRELLNDYIEALEEIGTPKDKRLADAILFLLEQHDRQVVIADLKDGASSIFRDHNCWRCDDGAKPCVQGHPRQCEYPHARND